MYEDENEFLVQKNQSAGSNCSWRETIVAVLLVLAGYLGSGIQGFEWILYSFIPLSIALFFMALHKTSLWNWMVNIKVKIEDWWILRKNFNEYEEFIKKAEIVKQLYQKVDRLDWKQIRVSPYMRIGHELSNFKYLIPKFCSRKSCKLIFLNFLLTEYLERIHGQPHRCEDLLINNQDIYGRMRDQRELEEFARKYRDFVGFHNQFCVSVNKKLRASKLIEFYGQTLYFKPLENS